MKLTIKDITGQDRGELEVKFPVIENGKGTQAVHDTVVAHLANQRSGTACTKTMGEVAGSGKKPWRQKGTGRARSGSSRSPLWVGGGTIFGPRPRSYAYRLPRSARRTALCAALALKQRQGELTVVSNLTLPEPKTKRMLEILSRLELGDNVLVVIAEADANIEKSARNLPRVKVLRSEGLNVYDLLRYRNVLFTQQALERVSERLAS